jgi:hypothetical protein
VNSLNDLCLESRWNLYLSYSLSRGKARLLVCVGLHKAPYPLRVLWCGPKPSFSPSPSPSTFNLSILCPTSSNHRSFISAIALRPCITLVSHPNFESPLLLNFQSLITNSIDTSQPLTRTYTSPSINIGAEKTSTLSTIYSITRSSALIDCKDELHKSCGGGSNSTCFTSHFRRVHNSATGRSIYKSTSTANNRWFFAGFLLRSPSSCQGYLLDRLVFCNPHECIRYSSNSIIRPRPSMPCCGCTLIFRISELTV